MLLVLMLVITVGSLADLVEEACLRQPSLPYCKGKDIRQCGIAAEPCLKTHSMISKKEERIKKDEEFYVLSYTERESDLSHALRNGNIQREREIPSRFYVMAVATNKVYISSEELEYDEADDISLEMDKPSTPRYYPSTTPVPLPRQNLLYTILPTLQKEKNWRKYCPVNQYTFRVTCLPGKRLRYDLQVFCQQFSDRCGVPNVNLFPSNRVDRQSEGRPNGYGQKQKNGNLGLGRSFAMGLGVIPGLELASSQGTDIGNQNLPFLNQVGGMMFNTGTEIGVMGQKTGRGPARSMNALTHGFPTLGLGRQPNDGDKKLSQEVLRSFGVPNVAGLDRVFKKLGGNRPKSIVGYEPGYGAVNPRAPFALGKTDRDALNLPGPMGDVEILNGVGMGIGK